MPSDPPPPDMDADVDHDGITWRFGRRLDLAAVAGLVLLASVFGALILGPLVGSGAAVVALIALLVALQALRSTTVRLTSRMVSLRDRAAWGRERQDVRVDDIVEARCARSDRGDLALVLKTPVESVVIGSREDEGHLRWMLTAIEQARAHNAVREGKEGREWSFLRRAPEELSRLRQDGG